VDSFAYLFSFGHAVGLFQKGQIFIVSKWYPDGKISRVESYKFRPDSLCEYQCNWLSSRV